MRKPVTRIDGLGAHDVERVGQLPGVANVEQHGDAVTLTCVDSDTALRALLQEFPGARDIEVLGANLEAAFLALTSDRADTTTLGKTILEETLR